jgi:hypothetical protein
VLSRGVLPSANEFQKGLKKRVSFGKIVVITGGSRSIGRKIAVDFARAGAHTFSVSLDFKMPYDYVISCLDTAHRYR